MEFPLKSVLGQSVLELGREKLSNVEPVHIRLKVALRASDVVRARLELFIRRLGPACVVWCVLAASGIYVLPLGGGGLNAFAAAIAIAGPPMLLALMIVWNGWRQHGAAGDPEPMEYCFHDDGIDVGDSQKAGYIPWEAFTEAAETSSAFLIFLQGDRHYLVPKRCFADSQEAGMLRELIASNVKR